MIDLYTVWLEIVEVPCFDLDEVSRVNSEYIDKPSSSVSQLFNQTWLWMYPRPREVVFDNGSEFKQDFIPLLKYFSIIPICTYIKNQINCWEYEYSILSLP